MDHLDYTSPRMPWTDNAGDLLLPIARQAIEDHLQRVHRVKQLLLPDWVNEPGACFVTLTQQGSLRGCIGSLMPYRPLINDVKENAVSAAVRDPRFTPLTFAELSQTSIELTLLSSIEPFEVKSEADALASFRCGIDGIILEWQGHRSTFLPQVWEQLDEPELFLAHLKLKAGLSVDFWAPDIKLSRYTVSKWKE